MYSKKIENFLKKNGISVGDRIKANTEKGDFEGLLMPRIQGGEDILVLKLDNGYNIGIKFETSKIKLVEKAKPGKAEAKVKEEKGDIAILGCGGRGQ